MNKIYLIFLLQGNFMTLKETERPLTPVQRNSITLSYFLKTPKTFIFSKSHLFSCKCYSPLFPLPIKTVYKPQILTPPLTYLSLSSPACVCIVHINKAVFFLLPLRLTDTFIICGLGYLKLPHSSLLLCSFLRLFFYLLFLVISLIVCQVFYFIF